jgi:lycopene cyclase CruA
MAVGSQRPGEARATPDLNHFRKHYPLMVMNFGALAGRESWLGRIWEVEERWRQVLSGEVHAEAVINGAPPADLSLEGEFDVIYAGGALGLIHAAVMACRHNRRVMVFDSETVGRTNLDCNVSDDDLRELEHAGLFAGEEIEAAVANRYRSGFVKFHDGASRVKTPPLWINGVLDVALQVDKLLALAAARLRARGAQAGALLDGQRFVRCYVEPHRVSVELEDVRTRRRRLFAARLFVETRGADSPVARQLNNDLPITHVCPTVGTVARGFSRGEGPDQVDFKIAEILISTEDASDHRQLMWDGMAGNPQRDEYTTCLFFYDAVTSAADKSLLALFERYFETLPSYKRTGAQWRVVKPIFGYIPVSHRPDWHSRRRGAADRVMLIGTTAGLSSPLALGGFGPRVRHLRRLTHLVDLALDADMLDAGSLAEISCTEPRVTEMAGLAEFMRPAAKSAPPTVNETLNAVMAALHDLDEGIRRELFQDRITLSGLKSLLGRTIKLYPRILQRVREHLGARGSFWWLVNITRAMLNERRRETDAVSLESAGSDSAAAREFARYLALYKRENGAGDQ